MQKNENPPEGSLLLYQAINEFFVEAFTDHKYIDEIIVKDAHMLQNDLEARFAITWPIEQIEKKIEQDCYLVPGKGFGFKRSDFFMPAKNINN